MTNRIDRDHAERILSAPGLLCFWDFQGDDGDHLASKGPHSYTLEEMHGKVARSPHGVFGSSSLIIQRGQWLRIRRDQCPALDIHGRRQVSMIAWIDRRVDNEWQYIAGVWNELDAARQYALFTSGHMQAHWPDIVARTPALHQAHGYVSDSGGATEGCKFCFSYATGATLIERDRWQTIAFTYDLHDIRVYVDGELDANGTANPFRWDRPIHDGGENGADFTVAQRGVPTWPDYPAGQPQREVGFGGLLGGLAVFDRVLDAEQMRSLAGA